MRRLWHKLIIGAVIFAVPVLARGAAAPHRTVFIDTPDSCYQVERLEGDAVYLTAVGVCEGKPGRAYLRSNADLVKILVAGVFWKEMRPQALSLPDVEASLKTAEDLAISITIPANPSDVTMKEVAEKVSSTYQSPEFQGRLKVETERIRQELFGDAMVRYYPEKMAVVPAQRKLAADERLYVFVSASMPLQTLRNYAASLARYGEPGMMMVLRGFVGGVGKMQPTIDLVGRIMQRDAACNPVTDGECELLAVPFGVDPLLFRRYGIDRVPAVVYASGVTAEDATLSEGDTRNTAIAESYTVFGDASLEYLIEQIQRETGSQNLTNLLAKN